MKDIYRQADEVVVWLGEEGGDTIPAFCLLYGLAELWPMHENEAKALISHVIKNELFRSYWFALWRFLGRPWWSRVWITQEIVMAQKATLVCGRWCADWDEVSKATASYNHCLDCMDEITEANILDQHIEFRTFQRSAASLKVLKLLKFFCKQDPANFHALLDISKNSDSRNSGRRFCVLVSFELRFFSSTFSEIFHLEAQFRTLGS
jgi:hypothetical protein